MSGISDKVNEALYRNVSISVLTEQPNACHSPLFKNQDMGIYSHAYHGPLFQHQGMGFYSQ
jgi:hypothetical protein